ncbi:MAG: ABC transporter ATP-binding protein [Clostridia bacterium]
MLIRVKDAVKKYGKGETEVYALDHAELELDEGKICVILGPSGSGKSTLLNMLGGLDTLDSGELTVAGRKVTGLSQEQRTDYRKEDVGFVFQFYNLIPDLTVEENIEVVADISAHPLDMDEVLRALDIEKYRRRFPKELRRTAAAGGNRPRDDQESQAAALRRADRGAGYQILQAGAEICGEDESAVRHHSRHHHT